jgi:hypothetical protein
METRTDKVGTHHCLRYPRVSMMVNCGPPFLGKIVWPVVGPPPVNVYLSFNIALSLMKNEDSEGGWWPPFKSFL